MLFEDAIDVHDRHWKIHWMLNFAQFSATLALNATIEEVKGEVDPACRAGCRARVDDRNWDSIEALWKMKEEVKGDSELRAAFQAGDNAAEVLKALEAQERGRRFVERAAPRRTSPSSAQGDLVARVRLPDVAREPAPIIEAVRGYLETDYDYPAALAGGEGRPRRRRHELMDGVPRARARPLQAALDLSLRHEPAHARPPLLHRPGHERAATPRAVAIGTRLVEEGVSTTPRT